MCKGSAKSSCVRPDYSEVMMHTSMMTVVVGGAKEAAGTLLEEV
jgi:hypothetical protein